MLILGSAGKDWQGGCVFVDEHMALGLAMCFLSSSYLVCLAFNNIHTHTRTHTCVRVRAHIAGGHEVQVCI